MALIDMIIESREFGDFLNQVRKKETYTETTDEDFDNMDNQQKAENLYGDLDSALMDFEMSPMCPEEWLDEDYWPDSSQWDEPDEDKPNPYGRIK